MYILYKTTNTVNSKYYIGVSNGNNKWYKGSGTALKNAIKKYGAKNFTTEIIETFETEEEAFARENHVVTEELVNDRNCYNMKIGGRGGVGQLKSESHKKKIATSLREYQQYITHKAGRMPKVVYAETIRIWKLLGQRKGAEYFGISVSAFKSRVVTAKKRLTQE